MCLGSVWERLPINNPRNPDRSGPAGARSGGNYRPRLMSMGRLPFPIPAAGEFQGRSDMFSDSVVAQPASRATVERRTARIKYCKVAFIISWELILVARVKDLIAFGNFTQLPAGHDVCD